MGKVYYKYYYKNFRSPIRITLQTWTFALSKKKKKKKKKAEEEEKKRVGLQLFMESSRMEPSNKFLKLGEPQKVLKRTK